MYLGEDRKEPEKVENKTNGFFKVPNDYKRFRLNIDFNNFPLIFIKPGVATRNYDNLIRSSIRRLLRSLFGYLNVGAF